MTDHREKQIKDDLYAQIGRSEAERDWWKDHFYKRDGILRKIQAELATCVDRLKEQAAMYDKKYASLEAELVKCRQKNHELVAQKYTIQNLEAELAEAKRLLGRSWKSVRRLMSARFDRKLADPGEALVHARLMEEARQYLGEMADIKAITIAARAALSGGRSERETLCTYCAEAVGLQWCPRTQLKAPPQNPPFMKYCPECGNKLEYMGKTCCDHPKVAMARKDLTTYCSVCGEQLDNHGDDGSCPTSGS